MRGEPSTLMFITPNAFYSFIVLIYSRSNEQKHLKILHWKGFALPTGGGSMFSQRLEEQLFDSENAFVSEYVFLFCIFFLLFWKWNCFNFFKSFEQYLKFEIPADQVKVEVDVFQISYPNEKKRNISSWNKNLNNRFIKDFEIFLQRFLKCFNWFFNGCPFGVFPLIVQLLHCCYCSDDI